MGGHVGHGWEVREVGHGWGVFAPFENFGGEMLCIVSNQTEERARLIAAAPALLEALEAINRRMSVLLNENEEVLTTTVQKHVVSALEISGAAVAKAKGEV